MARDSVDHSSVQGNPSRLPAYDRRLRWAARLWRAGRACAMLSGPVMLDFPLADLVSGAAVLLGVRSARHWRELIRPLHD